MKRKAYIIPISESIDVKMIQSLCLTSPHTPKPPTEDEELEVEEDEGDGIAE